MSENRPLNLIWFPRLHSFILLLLVTSRDANYSAEILPKDHPWVILACIKDPGPLVTSLSLTPSGIEPKITARDFPPSPLSFIEPRSSGGPALSNYWPDRSDLRWVGRLSKYSVSRYVKLFLCFIRFPCYFYSQFIYIVLNRID